MESTVYFKKYLQNITPELSFSKKRKFHAYCIGTARSGTHSIAGILSNYRSAHEPESEKIIDVILAAKRGSIKKTEKINFIKNQDRRLCLEINSSQLNSFFLEIYVKYFPKSKFILTIRDCYSWLESIINNHFREPCSEKWWEFRDFRFRPDKFKHVKEEQILAECGVYTLDGYLSYWEMHNKNALKIVPKERLLIIRTNEISKCVDKIANFLGIPLGKLNLSQVHQSQNKKRLDILSKIDSRFVNEKVERYCKKLMKEYFPGIYRKKAFNFLKKLEINQSE